MGVAPWRPPGRLRWWVIGALAAAVLLTQGLAQRPDPAAEPGLRMAIVLLLAQDAALVPGPDARPGDLEEADPARRAERAATVARLWAGRARAVRLAQVRGRPFDTGQVEFVATDWVDVDARADGGSAVVVGHLARRRLGGPWQVGPEQRWRIELGRGDPVGRQRGWTLRSVSTEPVPRGDVSAPPATAGAGSDG